MTKPHFLHRFVPSDERLRRAEEHLIGDLTPLQRWWLGERLVMVAMDVLLTIFFWMLLAQHGATKHVGRGVVEVQKATVSVVEVTAAVQAEVERLAAETARAQMLAIKVGVGAAIASALIGAFTGAFAARLVG